MPCRPSTSISRTLRPALARASAMAAATVVLPVPPLPVTTCSRTPSQSVSRALTSIRLSAPAPSSGRRYSAARAPGLIVIRLDREGGRLGRAQRQKRGVPMLAALLVVLIILVVGGLTVVGRSMRVVQQYERGLIFRFGKVLPETRGPELTIIRPIGDKLQKVNMQIIAMAVPAQEGITRDNVSVRVDAVVYFRVVDPIKAVVNVNDYMFAISQQAQT